MIKYAKSLVVSADLAICSLEQAIFDLNKLREIGYIKSHNILTLCCCEDNAQQAFAPLKAVEAQMNIIIKLIPVSYLDIDAWFITDGNYLIFSPGA